jgi:hypothetical protein
MRNTITLSAGGARNVGTNCCGESAPSLSLTYGYRLFPHLTPEAGVETALSIGSEARGANYDFNAHDRYIWVPFGLRAVLPVWRERLELSIGGGGTYEKYSVGSPAESVGFVSREGWGGYALSGVALALDKRRHWWLGTAPRLYFANTNTGHAHDRWLVVNLGLGLRF